MAGLFVKYHALAIQAYADVAVLHIISTAQPQQTPIEYDFFVDEGLPTLIVYIRKKPGSIADKLLFPLRYLRANFRGYKYITEKTGKPGLHHVHILTRAGLLAGYKKLTKNIPYIITEHWSRYLPQNSHSYKGRFHKWLTCKVAKNASVITTVSKHLGEAMQKHGLENEYTQVSNVVDINHFKPITPKLQHSIPVLLHVSCFDETPKNVKGILNVANHLELEGLNFELRMVGDGKDWQLCVEYAKSLGLKSVVFTGLKTGDDLLAEYQAADVFILFSNFENQPVVILEAFACGVPVIATRVGGIPEIVKQAFGLIIEAKHENGLASAIRNALANPQQFDSEMMRKYAENNFSYAGVGKQFYDIYNKVLK